MAIPVDDATFDAILADIATHGNAKRSLRDANVNPRQFWATVGNDDERANRYTRAKELGMAAVADEMLDIADQSRIGTIVTESAKGTETKTADMVERARLQVDTRKWLLARLLPKRYGDRTILAGDADNPLAFVDQSAIASKLLPELAAERPPATPGKPDPD